MRFEILGPLRVVSEDTTLPLGGLRQRAALGYLLLHPNQDLPTSQLVRALWPEGAPTTARKMLQNAIAGLRKTFAAQSGTGGGTPRLHTRPHGYLLQVDPTAVDMHRFDELDQDGRSRLAEGAFEPAAATLGQALALWHGPILADCAKPVSSGRSWPPPSSAA